MEKKMVQSTLSYRHLACHPFPALAYPSNIPGWGSYGPNVGTYVGPIWAAI